MSYDSSHQAVVTALSQFTLVLLSRKYLRATQWPHIPSPPVARFSF